MKARAIIEYLVGPTNEEVEEIVGIIVNSATPERANKRLKVHRVEFVNPRDYPAIQHAAGGCAGTMICLNSRFFHSYGWDTWKTLVAHELTHREQMRRAQAAGADPEELAIKAKAHYTLPSGEIDIQRYLSHPMELQALARNAVDALVDKGEDVEHAMRTGMLKYKSPFVPTNSKRFGKYAYQMLGR